MPALSMSLLTTWLTTIVTATPHQGPGHGYDQSSRLDSKRLALQYFGNDAPWYQNRVPYFECSDKELQDVYYYRWKTFRAHQRDLGERGYISTGKIEVGPLLASKDADKYDLQRLRVSR
jgi:hypothetical protein